MKTEFEVVKNRVQEIWNLHGLFIESLKKSLEHAMRIGELLVEQKSELPHGLFGAWIDSNMPFSIRTAQNYMKVYRERDRLKSATVSHLTEAYNILGEPKPLTGPQQIAYCYADCVNRAKEDFQCSWENAFDMVAEETGFPLNVLLNWHSRFFGIVSDDLIPEPWTKEETNSVAANFERIYYEVEAKQNAGITA
jgi:hypothetical protein